MAFAGATGGVASSKEDGGGTGLGMAVGGVEEAARADCLRLSSKTCFFLALFAALLAAVLASALMSVSVDRVVGVGVGKGFGCPVDRAGPV